ncbi:MAG: hypothetical protein FWC09_04115 [Lachnospiraceae bacterium]|nr:hypothetical protein [Lachnospiraceae bacterium]
MKNYFYIEKKNTDDTDLNHHFIMQKKISDELNSKFQSDEPFLDFLALICLEELADSLVAQNILFDYDSIILEVKENIHSLNDLLNFFVDLITQAEFITQKNILSSKQIKELFPQYCV